MDFALTGTGLETLLAKMHHTRAQSVRAEAPVLG